MVGAFDRALVVKWEDGVGARVTDRGGVRGNGVPDALVADLVADGVRFEPWLDLPPAELLALEARARAWSGREQPDLQGLHRVVVEDPTPERLRHVAGRLIGAEGVEFVTTDAFEVPPPGDLGSVTPDYTARQGWLDAEAGVDAWTAWETYGVDGDGIRIGDCEYGWHHGHEDLVDGAVEPEVGQTPPPDVAARGWDHHGTAVAGELIGQHNPYGVSGLAPGATLGTYPEWTVEGGSRRGSAISSAIADSAPGDVVLLEMQTGGPDGRLCPAEVNPAVWTIVRTGTDAGVVVVGAAGNGSANLDSAPYADYRSRGDSGAILVGAGSSNAAHTRMGFSTYGTRVDVHAWGQNVFTTGYGGFARIDGSNLQAYTATFSGTSSASPFIAGSAALLQQHALRYRLEPLSSVEVRDILVSTGTPAAADARIGPIPNLPLALAEVEALLDIEPEILSVTLPEDVGEGTRQSLSAEVAILPTHTGSIVWTIDGQTYEGLRADIVVLDDGPLDWELVVTDDFGREDRDSGVIEVYNRPPEIRYVGTPAERLSEGDTGTFTTETFDPGGDAVTVAWSLDGEPLGTGELAWTPTQDGVYTLLATPTDADGLAGEPVEVEVEVDDVLPTLTLSVPAAAERKADVTLAVEIDDPGDDVHTASWLIEDPDGDVTLEGQQVSHAWRDKEVHRVTVTVTDQDGNAVSESATLEVTKRSGCGCASSAGGEGLGGLMLGGLLVLWRRRSRRQAC